MNKLKRTHYIQKIKPFYHDQIIKIIVGIRRAGKSELLRQIRDDLAREGVKKDHIIDLRFDEIENEPLYDYHKLNEYIRSQVTDKQKYYVFCDEIQNVEHFEEVINSLNTQLNISFFLTGSNSRMLSEELSSVLSGRYVAFRVEPFSYVEIGQYLKKDMRNQRAFEDYVAWGALPKRFDYQDYESLRLYLSSVYDSIILRDVVLRLKLTDKTLFEQILQYAIDTIGREFSYKNLVNYLKANGRTVSNETLYDYIDGLTKSLILKKIHRYDIHGKHILKTLPKLYYTDFGLLQIRNSKSNRTLPYIYENVVLLALLYQGYEVYSGKTKKGEIDFVAIRGEEIKYIQVAISIQDEKTRHREMSAFDEVADHYAKYVITGDTVDYSENGVKWMNIIDFISGDAKI